MGPEPSLEPAKNFAMLVQQLLEVPAVKRYELLKTWSLPAEGRKNIRYYVGTLAKKAAPALEKRAAVPLDTMSSTMLLLADAAEEKTGKADER